MGKRGPRKGSGGRPCGGKHSEEQRRVWREKKRNPQTKRIPKTSMDALIQSWTRATNTGKITSEDPQVLSDFNQQLTRITDAFKSHARFPDPRDVKIAELVSQNRELQDRCTFMGLLLANYERRHEVLEVLVASSSQARKR